MQTSSPIASSPAAFEAVKGRKAVALGKLSSLFFSVTYIVNNRMATLGGSWLWSACLRFLIMFVPLLAIVAFTKSLGTVLAEIKKAPLQWIVWSTVGFGLFYAPLTFASAYAPSWLVAGTFQFTIFAGALLTPLFSQTVQTKSGIKTVRSKIPVRLFPAFFVILVGVFLLQMENAEASSWQTLLLFTLPVLVSAFAYPLGNRKTMQLCQDRLTTLQRIFAITLCSLPFWFIIAAAGFVTAGPPPAGQVFQAFLVALFSGLLATTLFFGATLKVRSQPHWLALVESTQCGEVVFTLLGGVFILKNPWPGFLGWVGLILIVGGMVFNSLLQSK